MIRWATTIFLTMTMFGFIGCSMCCGPYDFDYPTYGGIHHRSNPSHGRLGSVFSDPNAGIGPSADSNLTPHPEPTIDSASSNDADDLKRADEDLDDDLEGLDDELDELDRRLEQLDRGDDELESIEPLEDISLKRPGGSQAKSNPRRRGKFPRRSNRLR